MDGKARYSPMSRLHVMNFYTRKNAKLVLRKQLTRFFSSAASEKHNLNGIMSKRFLASSRLLYFGWIAWNLDHIALFLIRASRTKFCSTRNVIINYVRNCVLLSSCWCWVHWQSYVPQRWTCCILWLYIRRNMTSESNDFDWWVQWICF